MSRLAIAIAACNFALPASADDKNHIWLQVTPAGKFAPADGREIKVPHWYIDAAVASRVIERFRQKKNDRVVDYEHQTLHKEENGQPAPAAGWIRDLQWREGEGLYALVELTSRAAQYIEQREYRYFSPVFMYHPKTGEVLDVQMGALTNFAGIDGMQALALRAAATFGIDLNHEEPLMNELLKALLGVLGLSQTATEEEAVAALTAHLAAMRKTLGLDDAATGEAMVAACTGLKAKATATAAPDPAKFIAIEAFDQLKGEVAALSAQLKVRDDKDVESMIAEALKDGRLIKSQEAWARDLAKTNVAALSGYLKTAEPLAALRGSQTKGQDPKPDDKTGLTSEEMAVCTSMGLTPEQFKAAKE